MTAPAQDVPTTEVPKILSAIWKVMREVTSVAKSGQYRDNNTQYKFRSIDDLVRDLGSAFRDHGVFAQSEQLEFHTDRDRKTKSGVPFTTVRVKMRYRFTSLEDGSALAFESWGEGADTSDKATMKAQTMALKSALGQAFLLPTDEKDPDRERPGDDDYSPPVGGGQYDPNQAARQRQAAQREQAAGQGVIPPDGGGSRSDRVAKHIEWVRASLANEELTLERLSYIYLITSQRQLLGVETPGGVPLEKRIRAEMGRFGLDPNGAMPTPEQAKTRMEAQRGGGANG